MLTSVHRGLAFAVIVLNIAAGVWGIVQLRGRRDPARNWWVLLLTGHAVLLVQVLIGVAMFQTNRPSNSLHPFYGYVLLFAAILSHAYRTSGGKRRGVAILSGAALFVGIVGVRATLTGFA